MKSCLFVFFTLFAVASVHADTALSKEDIFPKTNIPQVIHWAEKVDVDVTILGTEKDEDIDGAFIYQVFLSLPDDQRICLYDAALSSEGLSSSQFWVTMTETGPKTFTRVMNGYPGGSHFRGYANNRIDLIVKSAFDTQFVTIMLPFVMCDQASGLVKYHRPSVPDWKYFSVGASFK
jgi:hypothetical protein